MKNGKTRFAGIAIAVAFVLVVAGPVMAFAAIKTNYDWYKGNESATEYQISTAGQMKALAALVNGTASYDADGDGEVDAIGAVSFEGKKIRLTSGLSFDFMGENISPIGTESHPFQGTFDGSDRQIDNFKLAIASDSSASVSNVGLFGYVGEHGSLIGVDVGDKASITIVRGSDSKDYISNVGMVAGYCGGTMTNCTNKGSIAITSEVVQQSKDDFIPVRNVGGVAGQCVYDMTGCENAGNISVSQLSSPVAAFEHAQVVARVGGVVGLLGDDSRIGTYDEHIYGDAAKHGAIDSCANTGTVTIDTPKLSGLDRFGSQTNAESVFVGGVVGYSQGSVTNCANGVRQASLLGDNGRDCGYVNAGNGVMVGGVCGSLRGVLADNTNIAWADDGADGNDPLVLSGCTNYGDVYGRVTVGGVVGKSSSYTTITKCLNSTRLDAFGNKVDTVVIATRWNKPAPGGIVGTANGEVSYCANFGTVASGEWTDEETRAFKTMDGYYAAGIAGMLTYFDDQAPSHGGVTTPISEVFSCYNAGSILAGANMRQRGIVGQNDGYTHDNVLISGLVYNDDVVYGDDPSSEPEASGAVGENRVVDAADLRGAKAAETIAFLNGNSQANGWTSYWMVPVDATAGGLNAGYPLLDTQDPWGENATSIADAQTQLKANAAYTGGESVPELSVSLGGVQLVENADYYVVPQAGAIAPSQGGAYQARVIGLGRYRDEASSKVAYDIVAGDFSTCSITAVAHTFDFEAQHPSADEVTVRTPAGTVVDPAEYTYQLVDDAGLEIDDPVNADMYDIVATPKPTSDKFLPTSQVKGTFRVKPASFMREVKFDDTTIEHLGETYPWVDSKAKGESDNPSTTLPYTGVAVKPKVGAVVYKGHTLEEGKDYRVVYGNSNSDDGFTGDQDANNMGKPGGKSIGCVTIRYISGQKSNFTSYANMFFNIEDTGAKADLSAARYVVEGDQISDGQPIEPVELYLGNTKLALGTDYTISYTNNVNPGTAHFVATGTGSFTGSLEGDFTIEEGSVYTIGYAYMGSGTVTDPYEATVTGVEYLSSRDTFHLEIPAEVEHDGHTYAVVGIADKAFGGSGTDDFSGSASNTSKLKIESVFVPASVRAIGKLAFGSTSTAMVQKPRIATVEFGAGSQLRTIGDYAFASCVELASFTFPEGVSELGVGAFQRCTKLKELRFLTSASDSPSSVASDTFQYCSKVIVRGFNEATAVQKLAADNGFAYAGANGGMEFTFVALSSLAGAKVTDIADQVYTGAAVKPSVVVTLDGARLSEGTDYRVSYEDNVNVGVAKLVVSGVGERGAQVVKEFKIVPAQIGRAEVTRPTDQPYTGSPVQMSPVVTFNGHPLHDGADYDVSYTDASGNTVEKPATIGSYRMVLTGKGNFTGTTYRAFRIVAQEIDDSSVAAIGNQPYTGAPVEPELAVKVAGVELERDRDYTLAFENNVEIGEATVHVYAIGGYVGEAQASFPIVAASVAKCAVAGVGDVQVNGSPVDFDPAVVLAGAQLARGSDYDLSFEAKKAVSSGSASGTSSAGPLQAAGALAATADDDKDYEAIDAAPSAVGSYRLVVTGKGNYTGAAKIPFAITSESQPQKTDLAGAAVSLDQDSLLYTGVAQKPAVSVSLGGSDALVEGRDYIVSYRGNVSVGNATVTVHGMGSYTGSASASFAITKAQIGAENVAAVGDREYTGSAIRPHLAVKVAGRMLAEGVDYTVSYGDNTQPGLATAHIQAKNPAYEGAADISFNIVKADLSSAVVTLTYESTMFNGSEQKPAATVVLGNRTLSAHADYDLAYTNNVGAGTALVTVTGKGNYEGATAATFSIARADLAKAALSLQYASASYTGSQLRPNVTVKVDGNVIAASAGFDVSYANNVNAGTATVTVTGKGNCLGSAKATFAISRAKIARPSARAGLVFNGRAQTGVSGGAGYTVSGGAATNAGSYRATATLGANYMWSDGSTAAASVPWSIAQASMQGASVSLSASAFTFNGDVQAPSVTAVRTASGAVPASGYSVSAPQSKDSGTYTVTVRGKGNYVGTATASYSINAASQKLVAKAKKPVLKAKTLKNKKQVLKLSKLVKLTGAKTTRTYAKMKGSSKCLTVNKKTGAVTVKKGTKKGTYKLKMKITAKKTANYNAASKTVVVKIRVK